MIHEPDLEPEVFLAKLKELGCPYHPEDSRCPTWLEGYKVGYEQASDRAIERLGKFVK